jgi:hypothetical protein
LSSKSSKWAKKLSPKCDVGPAVLEDLLKELSSSCYSDTETSMKVIEELTLSCRFDEEELRKFVREVSAKCPVDAKKLHGEILKSEGNKEAAKQAITRVPRML